MIGQALTVALRTDGWEVHTLTRQAARAANDPLVHVWQPGAQLDLDALGAFTAIVNLAGSSISQMPWTAARRADILDSRISVTTTLVEAITRATTRPKTFVSGSAVGFYGSRGDEILTEQSVPGDGFLADVCRAWEDAAFAAPKGVRVAVIRTGLVLARRGALTPLRLLTRLCVAGPLAGGRAWWPWVSLDDEVRAIVHILNSRLSGPINVVGPTEATSRTVMRALASAMRRPFWLTAPGWAIRLLLGRAGNELLLSSQRVQPTALEADGFKFSSPTVDRAIAQVLGEDSTTA
jgi:uncharacterized protein (TIGR01777 family)